MDKLDFKKNKEGPARIAKQGGFSTLELMIALAILSLTLTAVIMTSFGSQSFLIGSQTSNEAMKIAQGLIEEQQALARKDFNLVNATRDSEADTTFCPTALDGNTIKLKRYNTSDIYCYRVDVYMDSPDFSSKEVTVRVTWKDERGEWKNDQQMAKLTTLVANFDNVSSSNTCNSSPKGNWESPSKNSITISGSYPISGVDAYQDKDHDRLYVATSSTGGNNNGKDFLIFNLSSSGIPSSSEEGSVDTSGGLTAKGINAITVMSPSKLNLSGEKNTYAFIASAVGPIDPLTGSATNWTLCTPQGLTCSQLQVLDVSEATSPNIIANLKIPTVTGSGVQGVGKSIYYRNGYIFLGLVNTSSGPEFNIIDVHDPYNPFVVGGFLVGYTVNSINVFGNYAYLATTDNTNGNSLIVLDITDPTDIKKKWPSVASPIFTSSFGYGNALTKAGNLIYFGMTYNSTNPELFTLNNSNPPTIAPSVIVADSINLGSNYGLNGIVIRDYLINLILSPSNILRLHNTITALDKDVTLPGNGTTIDCQGNYLYVGDDSGSITSVTGS